MQILFEMSVHGGPLFHFKWDIFFYITAATSYLDSENN